jgi:hypothetical protein
MQSSVRGFVLVVFKKPTGHKTTKASKENNISLEGLKLTLSDKPLALEFPPKEICM